MREAIAYRLGERASPVFDGPRYRNLTVAAKEIPNQESHHGLVG
jgi:hypothetical protein